MQVSFGSELSNRAPTFDMDLSEYLEDGHPISYQKARDYFAQDPAQKWAAYVAGTILVLMTELGIQFVDSISILLILLIFVASVQVELSAKAKFEGVPEGKGVSSSTAVEVATMSAVVMIDATSSGVENHVVGAPCACSSLSVGGADYGSVRIGTFIGRKMIKSMAFHNNGKGEDGMELLKAEAAMDYLSNISPHRYEERYVSGNEFIENYGHRDDPVTIIDRKLSYAVGADIQSMEIFESRSAFKALLSAAPSDDQLSALGELIYQCHYSYNGSDGTDKLGLYLGRRLLAEVPEEQFVSWGKTYQEVESKLLRIGGPIKPIFDWLCQ
ncbi:hypothetical protein SASPL_148673 [Salvia splendens]|uniref:Uncharacterized protein n=1 Tax=Salvia splendens TaxID=180675 RepID=A0A8X8Z4B5_SALSN|nr:hypothetical protein SASPL_148673 [Salvia splendens]